jgi:hypothetical protein
MILKNEHGTLYIVTCDGCPECVETETNIFKDVVIMLKENGWLITKNGDDVWTHYCPVCKESKNDFKD